MVSTSSIFEALGLIGDIATIALAVYVVLVIWKYKRGR